MKKSIRLVLFATALALGCSASPSVRLTDAEVFDRLWKASEENDLSELPLAVEVLEDALAKTYLYSFDTRRNAFDLVEEAQAAKLSPLLRAIASMDYTEERGWKQTWDLIAIQESLEVLTSMRDTQAVSLNRARLEADSWLQTTAVENLQQLHAWDLTPEVANLLRRTPAKPENKLVLAIAIRFMSESPVSDRSICPQLDAIRSAFTECRDEHPGWPCALLNEAAPHLSQRLRCAGAKEP